ncbi:MAG: hypothetical protein ISS36_03960 [Candidatus Aenigmarchaeota archaeon]|nr:hypothetical protein [Candidatus Aenigmarchaeota archaeon]
MYRRVALFMVVSVAWVFGTDCSMSVTAGEKTTTSQFHFAVTDYSDFKKMPKPKLGDWLYSFRDEEKHEPFKKYIEFKVNGPDGEQDVLIIQPIGEFPEDMSGVLEAMRELSSIWFNCPAVIAEAVPVPDVPKKNKRERSWGKKKWIQYDANYLLDEFLKKKLAFDAWVYVGVTMEDLWSDELNFVFGLSTYYDRVAIHSLSRYCPEFYGWRVAEKNKKLKLMRCLATMVHETGHSLAMPHCVRYMCCMNGSNSLAESDRQPIYLCPNCLHKVHHGTGFDILERYDELRAFFTKHGFAKEAAWYATRAAKIREH